MGSGRGGGGGGSGSALDMTHTVYTKNVRPPTFQQISQAPVHRRLQHATQHTTNILSGVTLAESARCHLYRLQSTAVCTIAAKPRHCCSIQSCSKSAVVDPSTTYYHVTGDSTHDPKRGGTVICIVQYLCSTNAFANLCIVTPPATAGERTK